jgi:hypothetical protein
MDERRLDHVLMSLLRSLAAHKDTDGASMTRLGRAIDVLSALPAPIRDCSVSIRISQDVDVHGMNGTIISAIDIGRKQVRCGEHGFYEIKEECRSESDQTPIGVFSYDDSFESYDAKTAAEWVARLQSLVQNEPCRVKVTSE